ncbi:MAG: DUF2318 domain-containing protein [Anaerocolumna sp.]
MPNNKPTKKTSNQKVNPLMIGAVAVAAIAVSLVLFAPKSNTAANNGAKASNTAGNAASADTKAITDAESSNSAGTAQTVENIAEETVLNADGDVVINIADISENASFFEYDANGTKMGLFAVKASDGTIRTALNTCQVCNGSPYAYFEQQGDNFQCQNCGNLFSLDMIEQERGGCNPVPITVDDKTVSDTEIIIPAKYLEDNAERFPNWKNF